MDPVIKKVLKILTLVRTDADRDFGVTDGLGGDGVALLAQAALAHEGIIATPLRTQILAMNKVGSIKFQIDAQMIDVQVKGYIARIGLTGEVGEEAAMRGFIKVWERRCNTPWPGTPRLGDRRFALTRDCGYQKLPEDYFVQRAGNLLARAQAEKLSRRTPKTNALAPRKALRL